MAAKVGRVVYAFPPTLGSFFEKVAKPAGPRPVLLSYYYLRGDRTKALKIVEEWRKYSEGFTLILDSGVYTLRGQLGLGLKATSGNKLKEFSSVDWGYIFNLTFQKKEEIDKHVKGCAQFLKDAEGLYDIAVEMDMDDWMGVEYSDIYYEWLCEKVSSHKIMRVWHQSGRDFDGWLEWVKNPDQSYLCVEGGTILGRNSELYNKFITPAHVASKKVHILALTIPQILRDTAVDTADSSTFSNGARYGTVKIPGLGEITFSQRTDLTKNTSATCKHYTTLPPHDLEFCERYFESLGYTLDDVLNRKDSHYLRVVLTLSYYDKYIDVEYSEKPSHKELF